ncbi:MAG: hypothetical protein C0522_02535 [Rhodocyclaceae bacterium]|jgi:hypothetical protein|nr:hypothetical protein [Rhodocyclaceae bacterium]
MKSSVAIGADGLEDKDLMLLRSALKLRREEWIWVDVPLQADIWIVDAERAAGLPTPAEATSCRLVVLAGDPRAVQMPQAEVIAKPLKAMQLLRAIDRLLAYAPAEASRAAPNPPPAAAAPPVAHPWLGRRIRLLRAPSLSKYPVTVEMLSWVQSICHGAVSYDALIDALPLDRELLHAILNDAAHDGNLVDENGVALPALAGRKAGLMNRLFGK